MNDMAHEWVSPAASGKPCLQKPIVGPTGSSDSTPRDTPVPGITVDNKTIDATPLRQIHRPIVHCTVTSSWQEENDIQSADRRPTGAEHWWITSPTPCIDRCGCEWNDGRIPRPRTDSVDHRRRHHRNDSDRDLEAVPAGVRKCESRRRSSRLVARPRPARRARLIAIVALARRGRSPSLPEACSVVSSQHSRLRGRRSSGVEFLVVGGPGRSARIPGARLAAMASVLADDESNRRAVEVLEYVLVAVAAAAIVQRVAGVYLWNLPLAPTGRSNVTYADPNILARHLAIGVVLVAANREPGRDRGAVRRYLLLITGAVRRPPRDRFQVVARRRVRRIGLRRASRLPMGRHLVATDAGARCRAHRWPVRRQQSVARSIRDDTRRQHPGTTSVSAAGRLEHVPRSSDLRSRTRCVSGRVSERVPRVLLVLRRGRCASHTSAVTVLAELGAHRSRAHGRNRRRRPHPTRWHSVRFPARPASVGLEGGLVVMLIASQSEGRLIEDPMFWVVLALIAGLDRSVRATQYRLSQARPPGRRSFRTPTGSGHRSGRTTNSPAPTRRAARRAARRPVSGEVARRSVGARRLVVRASVPILERSTDRRGDLIRMAPDGRRDDLRRDEPIDLVPGIPADDHRPAEDRRFGGEHRERRVAVALVDDEIGRPRSRR